MTFEKLYERAFEQVASRLASFIRSKVILKKNKSTKWDMEKTHFANGKKTTSLQMKITSELIKLEIWDTIF